MANLTGPAHLVERHIWMDGQVSLADDIVATETPVALVYNGISHVVMMASPSYLEDFAFGFSLTEGIVKTSSQILDVEELHTDLGVELQVTLAAEAFAGLKQRRRNLVGRTGCGLCGAESLSQAITLPSPVTSDLRVPHSALQRAISELSRHQELQRQTGAVHGAAWCDTQGEIMALREDVGRHNALDKLIGLISRNALGKEGFVLVTSRASYEMVAKVASVNIGLLAAVSGPTSLAVTLAKQCGVTLVGFSRPNRHVIYCNKKRFVSENL
jgi:FdhD protein